MSRALAAALLAAACGSMADFPGMPGSSSGSKFGGPSPWGAGNAKYGAADGIFEQPVVGATTDEAQNLWVATYSALYVMEPGERTFRRFTAADGLHLPGNPVQYCDRAFAGGDRKCPISGAAADPGIGEIEGGAAGEVFVGYFGVDDGPGDWTDPNRHSGKLDRVRLTGAGALQVDRFDLVSTTTAQFWHNRSVQRMLYDHFQHAHELYVGTNHGVDRVGPTSTGRPARANGSWPRPASGSPITSIPRSVSTTLATRRKATCAWVTGRGSPCPRTATSGSPDAGPQDRSAGPPI